MTLIPPDPAAGDLTAPERPSYPDRDAICNPEHCFHAFDALYCALTGDEPVPPKFVDDKFPLFVTWNTRSTRPGRAPRLRGCIGSFDPLPLREGLAEYALISAFKDSRFRRIEEYELQNLECGISLLTDFEDTTSYLDWTIGVHGIHITFPHPALTAAGGDGSSSSSSSNAPSPLASSASLPNPSTSRPSGKRSFSATYLPDVIPDQGWDKIEAIDSAIHKAGWSGRITEDLRRSVRLRRYQSRKCVVGWDQFARWREANGHTVDSVA